MMLSKQLILTLLLVIGIIVTIPIISIAQVEEKIVDDVQKIDPIETIEKSPDETTTVKVFNASSIETGSKITSATIPVLVNGNASKNCIFELDDDVLNKIQISDEFGCSGSFDVKLNELGNYVLENNILYEKELKMIVKTTDTNEEIPSIVEKPVIEYKKPTYFAKVENGIVTKVIVADKSFVETKAESGYWVETFIDNYQRGSYAGIGYEYDSVNGWFTPPKPFDSWILNSTNFSWYSPTPYPNDGESYHWDEKTVSWVLDAKPVEEEPVQVGK